MPYGFFLLVFGHFRLARALSIYYQNNEKPTQHQFNLTGAYNEKVTRSPRHRNPELLVRL
jgi:hypothetical protein